MKRPDNVNMNTYHPKVLEIIHDIIVKAGYSEEEADRKIASLISDAIEEMGGVSE